MSITNDFEYCCNIVLYPCLLSICIAYLNLRDVSRIRDFCLSTIASLAQHFTVILSKLDAIIEFVVRTNTIFLFPYSCRDISAKRTWMHQELGTYVHSVLCTL